MNLPLPEDSVRDMVSRMVKEHSRNIAKEYKSGARTVMTAARFTLEDELEGDLEEESDG